jgi:catechol 2,3-dioxygenase-like lactoylglutathione lyase family enzyme
MIMDFDHVHVICGNIEKAQKFFEDIFDGKVFSRDEFRGFPIVRMKVKGVTLSLLGTDPYAGQLEPGNGSRGLDHFGFKVRDLENTVNDLKKKGVKVTLGPEVTPIGTKYAFIEGPEGIRIELMEMKE